MKNNVPFRSCISKINNAFIDNAEDLDIVMPMCKLLVYINYRDEMNDDANENNGDDYRVKNK